MQAAPPQNIQSSAITPQTMCDSEFIAKILNLLSNTAVLKNEKEHKQNIKQVWNHDNTDTSIWKLK